MTQIFFLPYQNQLETLCKRHQVRSLYVFGSVLTDRFLAESDIDMLVEFEGVDLFDYADNYFDFRDALENLFMRKIDLLEYKALHNEIFKAQINPKKQLLYVSNCEQICLC